MLKLGLDCETNTLGEKYDKITYWDNLVLDRDVKESPCSKTNFKINNIEVQFLFT